MFGRTSPGAAREALPNGALHLPVVSLGIGAVGPFSIEARAGGKRRFLSLLVFLFPKADPVQTDSYGF